MVIFFDIDETLLDQRAAEAAAAARYLASHGRWLERDYTVDEFCARWRELREKHLAPFFSGRISYEEHHRRRVREFFSDGPRLTDREADARYQAFLEEYRAAWRLFDDVLPALDRMADLPLAILSNGSSRQQREKLRRTGILSRFSAVVVSEDVGFAKPEAGIFRVACRAVGCDARLCVYVGDRLDSDTRGSQAAGLRGIWINRRRLDGPGDVETIHALDELRGRLDSGRATLGCAAPPPWPLEDSALDTVA